MSDVHSSIAWWAQYSSLCWSRGWETLWDSCLSKRMRWQSFCCQFLPWKCVVYLWSDWQFCCQWDVPYRWFPGVASLDLLLAQALLGDHLLIGHTVVPQKSFLVPYWQIIGNKGIAIGRVLSGPWRIFALVRSKSCWTRRFLTSQWKESCWTFQMIRHLLFCVCSHCGHANRAIWWLAVMEDVFLMVLGLTGSGGNRLSIDSDLSHPYS